MSKLQRTAKQFQDGWISFLRVLARNSKIKFVIRPNVRPCTDGKVAYLPSLPANLTEEDLILFKRWGYHEVGHIMHSDVPFFQEFSMEHGAFAGLLLNAVDDVIGMALVFPGNANRSVQNSYISVDLTAVTLEEPDDQEALIDEDSEELAS